jgi:hypothetical protein
MKDTTIMGLADRLIAQLEKRGHKTIVYYRDFERSKDFVSQIADAMARSDYTIALVTPRYLTSS